MVCLPILGTGRLLDDLDDSSQKGRETIRFNYKQFCKNVRVIYGETYLNRRPRPPGLDAIAEAYGKTGLRGCIGAIDCCRIKWKNCPFSLKGHFSWSKEGHLATIQVEAWCDHDFYIWDWFSGRCGTNNHKTMVSM